HRVDVVLQRGGDERLQRLERERRRRRQQRRREEGPHTGTSNESAVDRHRCPFHTLRAASCHGPRDTPVRHRNFAGLWRPSTTSATNSPRIGANLKPWPLSPAATTRFGRSGSRAIQKWPSGESQ